MTVGQWKIEGMAVPRGEDDTGGERMNAGEEGAVLARDLVEDIGQSEIVAHSHAHRHRR